MIQRTLLTKATPTLEISLAAGVWTIKTLSAFKNTEISFVPGKEFLEVIEDERKSTSLVTMEGGRLTHKRQIAAKRRRS